MAVEFDSFTATPFGEFVETPAGDRGGKASQLTDIIVNDVGADGPFTPIIIIIANATGITREDDPQRSQGYQHLPNLELDLGRLGAVLDAFDRANWDGLGRVRPNLRIGLLQPQYIGSVQLFHGRAIGGTDAVHEFQVQFNAGRDMLGNGFVPPLEGGVRLYYQSEFLSALSAVASFELPRFAFGFEDKILKGPSLPGDGLLGLWSRMSNGGTDKMQPWWTQVGLDQFDVFNQGQFRRGFVTICDELVGPRVQQLDSVFHVDTFQIPINFSRVYWGIDDVPIDQWLAAWAGFNEGGGPMNVQALLDPLPGSKVIELSELVLRQNPGPARVVITQHRNNWQWIRVLAGFIAQLIPGG